MPSNWPSAAAINHRIALSESVNGRHSALHNRGEMFVKMGRKYRINPGVVVAIAQRECQLGADGSALPRHYNFGGITDPTGRRGTCGNTWLKDRFWAKYCNPDQGIEGIFQVLNSQLYRNTDGTIQGIINLYSPAFENDLNDLYAIFRAVGQQLNITLDPATPIYSRPRRLDRLRRAFKR